MSVRKVLFPIVFASFVASCSPVVATPPAADEDAPMTLQTGDNLLLTSGDTIKLTVYGEDTLSSKYQIDQNGQIILPLLGKVDASDMTRDELQQRIKKSLISEGYIRSPQVTVDMDAARPVFVMGEVRNPGSYGWQPTLTAFQAIASAGGYTPRAARGLILVDRRVGKAHKKLNATEQTPLLPGDSVTVRERIL